MESNHSGRHVPSQPHVIPSSSSMVSRDKRLPFETWNTSELQENVFGNSFLHMVRQEIILKEFIVVSHTKHQERYDEQSKGIIQIPMFARRPSTMSSSIPVEIPQNPMVGQQRQQISELRFDKFPTPHSFFCWKIRFKSQVTTCSDFPSDAMFWINEVEMVQNPRDQFVERIFQTSRCWTRRLLLL